MTHGRFDSEELVVAGMVGVLREVSALTRGRPDAHDCDRDNAWTYHVNGVAAEIAVAKQEDHYWRPLSRGPLRGLPDVGVNIQVRSTTRRDGSLIVHKSDPDTAVFYLVVTDLPDYWIVGRITARDAKQPRFWRMNVPHPAYFVPQSELERAP
jgi:hypothetical protein